MSENGEQSGIHAPLLLRCEMTGKVTEALDVDGTDLFDENASSGAVDVDPWPEGRRPGARRRRRNQHDRTRQESVGLHDDTEAKPSLLVSHTFGQPESEDVTPTHGDSP